MPELFTRRSKFTALLGSAAGLSAVASGFACYLRSTPCEDLMRIALYLTVFAGALIFAASTVIWLVLCGKLARVTLHPGGGVVNLTALLLGVWMGYGFVTEHALGFGVAVLLVMSLLAAALGAHLMVSGSAGNGRYGLAASFGERSPVRCGSVRRRVVLAMPEGFEWPDEQMPALFDDDFAQSWLPLDEIGEAPWPPRFCGCRRGRQRVLRERGRRTRSCFRQTVRTGRSTGSSCAG